ncbi:MAG TPA: hypothetical protein VFI25_12600 [Planctomycetota bacterium]|nr:hypothetical protein [Planctomycetota bacterium]
MRTERGLAILEPSLLFLAALAGGALFLSEGAAARRDSREALAWSELVRIARRAGEERLEGSPPARGAAEPPTHAAAADPPAPVPGASDPWGNPFLLLRGEGSGIAVCTGADGRLETAAGSSAPGGDDLAVPYPFPGPR